MKKEDFPQHDCGEELHDECFAILADEPSDAYQQEQLALCLRFVNKTGQLVEWFLGLVHVKDTTSLTLKEAIKSLLIKCHLPLSKRWRGYNDDDDSYPSRLPINLDDRARHGDSGDGRPSLFSSAFKQEESAKGWGVVVEERGASAIGEVASVVMPGWFGHDRSAVDDDGNELGTTGSGDSKLAHLCDFFLSFAPFF
ncbi:hypothetical protein OsI_33696 [Oryza sativa Indica Group]|uniref:DUF4371 domain-containing protein n=1 Tax=Oryza sativa subsp. indica TaxID=39946 RepID=B8BGZ3_ORYSI|nr:hypothetical protein OsI_33696 [Oryza sativa Indica Group]